MTSIQQRAALQSSIWKIANEVRGAVDGWDFKQYVLGTLFYRFISENFAANAGKSGGEFFTPQQVSKLIARLAMHGQSSLTTTSLKTASSGKSSTTPPTTWRG